MAIRLIPIFFLCIVDSNQLHGQLAFHVEQPNTVLFGSDTLGSGSKLMWIPSKAALRAGKIDANQWNYDSIGYSSIALGTNSIAHGYYSLSMGMNTEAKGVASIALGYGTQTVDTSSMAVGISTTALAKASLAIGEYSTASGRASTAMGYNTKASGNYSISSGNGTEASGENATAMGNHTFANLDNSLVVGRYNKNGDFAIFDVGVGLSHDERTSALTVTSYGEVRAGTPGGLKYLFVLNSARPWGFYQRGSGAGTSLVLKSIDGNKDFIIETDGQIGINDIDPFYKLELPNASQESLGQARAYDWDTYSDKRVKRNISETPYGLQEVLQLQPVIYDHHSAEFEGENGLVIDDEDFNRELGFIAQEVYEILPEMVCKPEDENSDLWSLSYTRLIPVLTKAIQEQQDVIRTLFAKNEELEKRLIQLEASNPTP